MKYEADLDDEFPMPAVLKFDRRREQRNTAAVKVTMTILNGPGAGTTCQVQSRDSSFTGVSFCTDQPLSLGQTCQLLLENPDQTFARFVAQVIRSRTTTDGKFDIAMRFKRQIAA